LTENKTNKEPPQIKAHLNKQMGEIICFISLPSFIMKIICLYFFTFVVAAADSLAAPVIDQHQKAQIKQKDAIKAFGLHIGHDKPNQLSLVDLLHRQPTGRRHKNDRIMTGFDTLFARSPEIASLDNLAPEELVPRVMQLRKAMEDDTLARINLRKAILHYMQRKEISPLIIDRIKDQYDTSNTSMLKKKQRIDHPIKMRERDKVNHRKKKENKLKKEATTSSTKKSFLTFEEQMILYNIPKDADALQMEEESRKFMFSDTIEANSQLERYLSTRFDPSIVQIAISRRRIYSKNSSHREAVRQYRKRKAVKIALQQQGNNKKQKKGQAVSKGLAELTPLREQDKDLSFPRKPHTVDDSFKDTDGWWDNIFR
jgi:hypothetical protein